jgi:hypothetical protein
LARCGVRSILRLPTICLIDKNKKHFKEILMKKTFISILFLSSLNTFATDYKIHEVIDILPWPNGMKHEIIKDCGELECTTQKDIATLILDSQCLKDNNSRYGLLFFKDYYSCPSK